MTQRKPRNARSNAPLSCVLCRKPFTEYGNDPWPVSITVRCCNACNALKVVPARLRMLVKS